MTDWLINLIFRWDRLRDAIFAEVNWYNSISRTLHDPEAIRIGSTFWDEGDGWRGWSKSDTKYHFIDTPEKDLFTLIQSLDDMENIK